MFRNRNDEPPVPYPVSRPGGDSQTFEEFLGRLQQYFEEDNEDAFWDAVDSAPGRWQRRPEFMLIKAVGLLRAGEDTEASELLSEVERAHPKYLPVYFYQANLYLQEPSPAHALRAINSRRDGPDPGKAHDG